MTGPSDRLLEYGSLRPGGDDVDDLKIALAVYVAEIEEILQTIDLTIETGGDFLKFRRETYLEQLRGHVAPIFDPAIYDIDAKTAFWMLVRDSQGSLMFTQAMKLVEMGGRTLGEYLAANLAVFRPHGDQFEIERSFTRQTMSGSRLCGLGCYHGEVWLRPDYRKSPLTGLLPRLMIALGTLRWSPDFFFGVMEPMAAMRGLAAREGYMHLEQGSISWFDPACSKPFTEWLIWLQRDEVAHLLEVSPADLMVWLDKRSQAIAAKM